jgi:hypothetical protein
MHKIDIGINAGVIRRLLSDRGALSICEIGEFTHYHEMFLFLAPGWGWRWKTNTVLRKRGSVVCQVGRHWPRMVFLIETRRMGKTVIDNNGLFPGISRLSLGMDHSFPGISRSFLGIHYSFPGISGSFPGIHHSFPGIKRPFRRIYRSFPGMSRSFPFGKRADYITNK